MGEAERGSGFQELASKSSPGLVSDTLAFLRENKKWWLIPVIAALVLLGVFVVLGGTAAAPFIYTLF